MNPTVIKIGKTVAKVVINVGIPLAINFYEGKVLDKKIADGAAEVFNKMNKKES